MVDGFLTGIIAASRNTSTLPNRGLKESARSQTFAGGAITGSALLSEGQVVHLSAHQKCPGQGRPFSQLREQFRQRNHDWKHQSADLLADLNAPYVQRRRRYERYKDNLTPVVHNDASQPTVTTQLRHYSTTSLSARPRPLNPPLHNFFLRLFSRG